MVPANDDQAPQARPPTLEDLLDLCRRLNAAGAKYIVIGGMAVIQHGFVRATEDIDLLVGSDHQNIEKIRTAMMGLPDGAIRDLHPDDLDTYIVVRIGDEFVVDLMKAACGVEYAEASKEIVYATIHEVAIPFASPALLLRLKQTYREKDALDRMFLERLIAESHN